MILLFKQYHRPILWAFFIALLCGMPGKSIPHISWLELLSFDKFVHASLFFVLIILIKKADKGSLKRLLVFTAVCIAYGGLLELMQAFWFTERSADWMDFTANTIGCCSGLLAGYKSS